MILNQESYTLIACAPQPAIHLNGSSPEQLRDDAIAALEALYDFRRKFVETAPHNRDYYILPDAQDKMMAALHGHRAALDAIDAITNHLTKRIVATEGR